MKIVVSLEDSLTTQTDARDPGLSRSRLVAQVLRAFLHQRQRVKLTQQLNRAYARLSAVEGTLVRKMRSKFPKQDWQDRW